eukprot:5916122-Pyramimonas_sp.AAC.1
MTNELNGIELDFSVEGFTTVDNLEGPYARASNFGRPTIVDFCLNDCRSQRLALVPVCARTVFTGDIYLNVLGFKHDRLLQDVMLLMVLFLGWQYLAFVSMLLLHAPRAPTLHALYHTPTKTKHGHGGSVSSAGSTTDACSIATTAGSPASSLRVRDHVHIPSQLTSNSCPNLSPNQVQLSVLNSKEASSV